MSRQISAIDIKKLWHADPATEALTPSVLNTILKNAKVIKNVHQDTWTIDESESSQDLYKNQLTGATYRMGAKTMGDVTFNFTIGRYDYKLKAELMGGTVITKGGSGNDKDEAIGWSRQRGIVEMRRMLIALTEDDVYCVLPYANVSTREANTDGAVGLAVVGTMMEPENENIDSEYWYDAAEVDAAATDDKTT